MYNLKTQLIRTLYVWIYKPLLFRRDPELAHDSFARMGVFLGKHTMTRAITRGLLHVKNSVLRQTVCSIHFQNPVGLSAGFDKDANLVQILPSVGFGFVEIGSITLEPYHGNSGKRLVRLPASKSIIVNYGLKNVGSSAIIQKLSAGQKSIVPMIISIAKTNCKETVDTEAGIRDYYECLRRFYEAGIGDMYDINISCPNAYGGEPFTTPDTLERLLSTLDTLAITKPVFVKMPINLSWDSFSSLLGVVSKHQISGVIIGNLNKNKHDPSIKDPIPEGQGGGLSGTPCFDLSNELISKTYQLYKDKFVIIGVGGIFSAEDAYEKIKRGATLVQLITGMIYEGPQVVGEINRGLVQLLKKDGFNNISQAVGARYRH